MLRFVPDSIAEGLMRPLLLLDPAGGLYLETMAPDARFAALVLLGVAVAITTRCRRRDHFFNPSQRALLVGMAICFYAWTFVSGNGRYFFWALLVVGPAVAVMARGLPVTTALRNTLLIGLLAAQVWLVHTILRPNVWAVQAWHAGPSARLAANALQATPAVYFTIDAISYSILVPLMHPQSRWSNIAGQSDIVPEMPEHEMLRTLVESPLPKYMVLGGSRKPGSAQEHPQPKELRFASLASEKVGVRAMPGQPCTFVASVIASVPYVREGPKGGERNEQGFWFCPLEKVDAVAWRTTTAPVAEHLDNVFERIESLCPRLFPKGNARTQALGLGVYARTYSHSDTGVTVGPGGQVFVQNFRAFEPIELGTVESVRSGNFTLSCDRLPGRYVPPWMRP